MATAGFEGGHSKIITHIPRIWLLTGDSVSKTNLRKFGIIGACDPVTGLSSVASNDNSQRIYAIGAAFPVTHEGERNASVIPGILRLLTGLMFNEVCRSIGQNIKY